MSIMACSLLPGSNCSVVGVTPVLSEREGVWFGLPMANIVWKGTRRLSK